MTVRERGGKRVSVREIERERETIKERLKLRISLGR